MISLQCSVFCLETEQFLCFEGVCDCVYIAANNRVCAAGWDQLRWISSRSGGLRPARHSWITGKPLGSRPVSCCLEVRVTLSSCHSTTGQGETSGTEMRQAREFSRVQGWRRVIPLQLAPLFLLMAFILIDSLSTPAFAAPAAVLLDQSDGCGGAEGPSDFTLSSGRAGDAGDQWSRSSGTREAYLDYLRFAGAVGVSRPQIRHFGDLLFFEARGPPGV